MDLSPRIPDREKGLTASPERDFLCLNYRKFFRNAKGSPALMVSLLVILTVFGLLYHVVALVALWRLFAPKKTCPPLREGPGITVLKPVKGLTPETRECLESFLRQDYHPYQVLFGVASAADPIFPLLRELQAKTPPGLMEIVLCEAGMGQNPKVSTLRQLEPRAAYGLLVVADQDVRVGPDFLGHVAAAFTNPHLGMLSCPYRGGERRSLGAALEALIMSGDFMPGVAVARCLEGISFALGATMALTRPALARIGGFAAVADHLADDYQLGNRIFRAGYKVDLLPIPVETVNAILSFREFLAHQGRWARTLRVSRPAGYLGYGLTHTLVFALALGLVTQGAPWALGLLAGTLALRLGLTWFSEVLCLKGRLDPGQILLIPVKDLLSFFIWLSSFFIHEVTWQGRRYRLSRNGTLSLLK